MDRTIIKKYLNRTATEEERKLAEAWIETQGGSWLDNYIDENWVIPSITSSPEEKERIVAKVFAALKERSEPLPVMKRRRFLGWAAAACLLIVAGVWWQTSRVHADAPQLSWQTIRNDRIGITQQVYLPDSSLVILNAHSMIRYADNYNVSTRELQLTGEAFFDVTHDAKRPFIVHTDRMNTLVYGTAFNISAYPEASQLRISLKRGRIGITRPASPEQILQPGELFVYDKSSGLALTDRIPTGEIGLWTNGSVSFYKTPLKDVFISLEKKYGVQFSYNASLKDLTITAGFEKPSLEQLLQHLSFVWNIQFQQKKNVIYVK